MCKFRTSPVQCQVSADRHGETFLLPINADNTERERDQGPYRLTTEYDVCVFSVSTSNLISLLYKHTNRRLCSESNGCVAADPSGLCWEAQDIKQLDTEIFMLVNNPFPPFSYYARLLNLSLNSEVVLDQDAIDVIIHVARNPHGRDLAWKFFREKWKILNTR